MLLTWVQGSDKLSCDGKIIPCSCNVRNELNKQRSFNQIVRTMPGGKPYMPRIFPKGRWLVGLPESRAALDRAPFFIPTDGWQKVAVWEIKNNLYVRATDETDIDRGYGIHYSIYPTTLGCIRITHEHDLQELVTAVCTAIYNKESVILSVE